MSRGFKTFLIAFVLSLPFWLFVGTLQADLEDFFFIRETNQNQLFLAQMAPTQGKGLVEPERVGEVKPFSVNAKSAISVWLYKDREKILFEKDKNKKLPIASVTKLMTSVVVYDLKETYSLSEPIKITREAVEQNGKSEFRELRPGEELTSKNLLKMSLVESSNDAAFALAQYVGEEGFVSLMNLYAEKLKLSNTDFFNPTGLDEGNGSENYSTTYDLVKLSDFILENHPEIFEITSKNEIKILNADKSLHHVAFENTNELLKEMPEMVGGKTGYTEQAKGCLLIILEAPNNKGYVVNVILGSPDRFQEMKKLTKWIHDNYTWK